MWKLDLLLKSGAMHKNALKTCPSRMLRLIFLTRRNTPVSLLEEFTWFREKYRPKKSLYFALFSRKRGIMSQVKAKICFRSLKRPLGLKKVMKKKNLPQKILQHKGSSTTFQAIFRHYLRNVPWSVHKKYRCLEILSLKK